MASTYSPQDAINLVAAFGHGIPLADVQVNVCDMINSMIWVYFPWGWSISSLTAINLTDKIQDYTPADTNILRPLKLRIVRTDTTPKEYRELSLLANLGVELTRTAGIDTMKAVGWFPSQNFFRFDVAVSVSSGTTLQLQGEYQQTPTKITASNLTTPFTFPDHYFNTFVEGIKWKIYQLGDDPRAGGRQLDNRGNVQNSGQYGVFIGELNKMARTEDLGSGDEFMFPEQPIGIGRSYWPGLFGV